MKVTFSPDVAQLHGLDRASSRLGDTSQWTLRKHIALGNIKIVRIGKRIFITEEEIQRIQREGLPSLPMHGQRSEDSKTRS